MSDTAARTPLAAGEKQIAPPSKRRSLLDLAPLELACMNALWPLGEASVRDIRARVAAARPRAYTTIMTVMDRLARKGIVERHRAGRVWLYRPNLTADEARAHAVAQVVEGFFGGSAAALAEQLSHSALASLRQSEGPVAQTGVAQSPEMREPPGTSAPARAGDLPASPADDTLL